EHTAIGEWVTYSTERASGAVRPMTFQEFTPGGSLAGPVFSMATLAASNRADDLVLAISVHTDSGWDGFDGALDALEIGLTNGKLGRVDFTEGERIGVRPS